MNFSQFRKYHLLEKDGPLFEQTPLRKLRGPSFEQT